MGRKSVTCAALRCLANNVNKVRLQPAGIWPCESTSLYNCKNLAAKLVGMCLKTSATSPHSSADLFNFNFCTAPISSCNVQGSSVKWIGCMGASGLPANSFSNIMANSSNAGCWCNGLLLYEDIFCNSFQRAGYAKYFWSKVAFHCLDSFRCSLWI